MSISGFSFNNLYEDKFINNNDIYELDIEIKEINEPIINTEELTGNTITSKCKITFTCLSYGYC